MVSVAQRNDERAYNFGRRLKKLAKDAVIDKKKEVVNYFFKHLIPSTSQQLVTYSTKSMKKAMDKAKRTRRDTERVNQQCERKKITPLIKQQTPTVSSQATHAPQSSQTIVRILFIYNNLDASSIPRLWYSNS